ncbi:MAG: tRNA (adenosine(37)-N6)-dimethylallyltransferase MiaA [Treponema sp.]|nr:tRNA (adenosine(37)-N6)-dimethylallyltransferase MiaA [Treponema sp.]
MDVPVLILFGPTASGKTAVLLNLFGGGKACPRRAEIISADSMQVYRGMDIGTAKPSTGEQALLPHHLIDIRDPNEQFNAGDFVRLAGEACIDIARRGKLPVISGGTGFYLKNFIMGLPEAPPADLAIRARLKADLQVRGAGVLMEELASGDPVSARRIHINDEYRMLRALEVLRLTGRPLSSFQASGASAGNPARYRFLVAGLSRPREELYRRINLRTAAMFRQGLPGEVRKLYEAGYTPRDPGLRAIGYREFFTGDTGASLPEETCWRFAVDCAGVEELVARNSRRYAKRQITFFAAIPGVEWIEAGPDDTVTAEKIRRRLDAFLQEEPDRAPGDIVP